MAPKQKAQKMGLGEFLGDSATGSWADEMDDLPAVPGGRSTYGADRGGRTAPSYGGFGGGDRYGGDREYTPREQLPLPTRPPYTAHLGNMSFDVTEGDVHDFFAGCEVTSVRIVEDKMDRKPKGFGYVEFATLDGLKKALDLSGSTFQGRGIRVSVAEPSKDREPARDITDWSRKGPLPDLPQQQRRNDRPGFGAPRETFQEGPDRRRGPLPPLEGDGKMRDFGNWERKGPLPGPPPMERSASNRFQDRAPAVDGTNERRGGGPSWGEGRSQDGSRPPRKEFVERPLPIREPTAADLDNQWRSKMRPDPPTPVVSSPPSQADPSVPSSPALGNAKATPPPPATRPKLNLQKRTITTNTEASPLSANPTADPKSSPFGAARPIDTSARDREVEEKLRAKKEQEDKAREEKRAADEKAKKEREAAAAEAKANAPEGQKEREPREKPRGRANGQPQRKQSEANGDGENRTPKYQILRHTDEDNDMVETGEDADAHGVVTESKDVKPQAVVVEGDANANVNGAPTETAAMEEEGWSTVSKPVKKGRGGPPRAIAS